MKVLFTLAEKGYPIEGLTTPEANDVTKELGLSRDEIVRGIKLLKRLNLHPDMPLEEAGRIVRMVQQAEAGLPPLQVHSPSEIPDGASDDERDIVVRLNGRTATEMAVIKADPEIGYVDFYCDQRAGMGPGRDVMEYTESVRLPIIRRFLQPYRPDEVRALEARGDSMSKIGIFDRDIVLYVPEEKEGDGVFVISRDNKLQVKRIEFDITDKEIRIISENDRYQPKVLRGEEADSIVVEGKVIGWLHRHPY